MITQNTLVARAWTSSSRAPQIAARHGVDPGQDCSVVRDTTTLANAEDWCGFRDPAGLIAELNAATQEGQLRAPVGNESEEVAIMQITPETVVYDVIEAMPGAREMFLAHGCDMDAECTNEARGNTLDEAIGVCHLEDLEGLILELQALADILVNGEQG